MLYTTSVSIPKEKVTRIKDELKKFPDIKTPLNKPTENFFYDEWFIKEELKGTIWEEILSYFPDDIGEARIIRLESGKCYLQHSDIDDRYHLNISGDNSYLYDIDNNEMHLQKNDGIIYEMDAGRIHSAINLGVNDRYQLVVRKRLIQPQLSNRVKVTIRPICKKARFVFDNKVSTILNSLNKSRSLANFEITSDGVLFDLEKKDIERFANLDPREFDIRITT
jgi:hypothetical protein